MPRATRDIDNDASQTLPAQTKACNRRVRPILILNNSIITAVNLQIR